MKDTEPLDPILGEALSGEPNSTLSEPISLSQAEMDARNASEDLSARTLFSKTFSTGDGYRQSVLYAHPVHYASGDSLLDIDHTFITSKTEAGAFETRSSDIHVTCKPIVDSQGTADKPQVIASLQSGGYELSLCKAGIRPQKPSIMKENGAAEAISEVTLQAQREKVLLRQWGGVEYQGIGDGISLRCIVCPQGFKDEWVFDTKEAIYQEGKGFAVHYHAPGLIWKPQESGLQFLSANGEVTFTVSPASLVDADSVELPLTTTFVQEGEFILAQYEVKPESFETARFPLILDPLIYTGQSSTGSIVDTRVNSDAPTTNYVNSTRLYTRNSDSTSSSAKREKSYLKIYPLPYLKTSDYVVGAYLRLRKGAGTTTNMIAGRARELTGSVNMSTVTFNTSVSVNPLNQDHQAIVLSGTNYFFDLTDLARKWYLDGSKNYGIGLFSDYYIEYYSANDTGSGTQPYLMVNYFSLAGLEGYLSYDTIGLGRAGDAHVSLYNGNLIFSHADTASSGGMPSVSVTHYYNSCFAARDHHGLGRGWRCNYNLTLHRESIPDATGTNIVHYVLIDGDGTYHYFKPKTGGGYDDLSGMSRTLAIAGSVVTITDKAGTVLTFDLPTINYNDSDTEASNNYLTALKPLKKITDARGHAITLTFVPGSPLKIQNITDGSYPTGRVTNFIYSSGRLSEICSPGYSAGAGVQFTYNTSGQLVKIKHEDMTESSYAYLATSGLLQTATDPDNRVLTLAYANYTNTVGSLPHRLTSAKLTGGTLTGLWKTFTYAGLSTKVTDYITGSAGKSLIYHFNDMGNLLSVSDELGYSVGAQYSTASPVNHPDTVGRMERAVINLLTDGSFELGSSLWTNHNTSGTGTFVRDQTTCQAGLVSQKITIAAAGSSYTQQTVTVPKGKAYTLSGYVKTTGATRALLRVVYTPASGQPAVTVDSAPMVSIAGFTRVHVSFTLPAAAVGGVSCRLVADTAAGSAWFDCVQLETGETVNRYNLLQNADFRQGTAGDSLLPTYWEKDTLNDPSFFELSATELLPPSLSGRAARLRGRFQRSVVLYHELRAYGSIGDVYVAGGWGKGYAKKSGVDGAITVHNAINVQFTANGSTWVTGGRIQFNHEEGVWQTVSGPVKATINYNAIRFVLEYQNQINDVLFTNLFLYQERFGGTFLYDANGNLQSAETLTGTQSNAVYDTYHNLTSYRAPGRSATEQTTINYGATDAEKKLRLPRTTTSPLGIVSATTYHASTHRPIRGVVRNSANTLLMGSDTEHHAGGNYTSKQYDARSKLTSFVVDLNRGTLTSTTAPNGQVVSNAYDASKRITAVSATYTADGASKTAANGYTYTKGKLTQVAHNTTATANDVQYNFAYDALNRPTTVKVGTATLSTNNYNANGTLANVTYGNNGKVAYVYDAFKRVSGLRYDAQSTDRYQYAYDAEGRLGWVKDNTLVRVHSSAYDTAGRPVLAQTMAGTAHVYTAEVDYDTYNNIAAFREKVGASRTPYATTGSYDAENRPTLLTYGSASNSVGYGYDGVGRVSARTAKIGSATYTTTYGYLAGDAARYGTGATTPLVSGITQTEHNLAYTYDDVGNILSCAYGGKTTRYIYDTLGQLIRVNDPHDVTSGATGTTWTYHYDQGGNILSVKRYAYTTGTLGAVLQTIPYAYTDANWKDKLTSYNGVGITYDAIGNPLTDGTWTYAWQAGRQLVSMTKTGTTANFLYNADGLRTRKTVNSTVTDYTLHGKNIVHLTQGSNNLHFFYDVSGRPSHVNWGGTMYLYVHNLQGDIIAIRDAAGNNVVTYSYNTWGKQLSKAGSLASTLGTLNPFRYRGYVYDEETGLYYLRSRYYNPGWQRFVNADLLIGETTTVLDHNIYVYCKSNPVSFLDPSGKGPVSALIMLLIATLFLSGCTPESSEVLDPNLRHKSGNRPALDEVMDGQTKVNLSKDATVWNIQELLRVGGYLSFRDVDKEYGIVTKLAVKAFQEDYNRGRLSPRKPSKELDEDGWAGLETQYALMYVFGSKEGIRWEYLDQGK